MAWLKVSLPSEGVARAGAGFEVLVFGAGFFAATFASFVVLTFDFVLAAFVATFFDAFFVALFAIRDYPTCVSSNGASMVSGCMNVKRLPAIRCCLGVYLTGQSQYFSSQLSSSRTLIFPCHGF